MNRENPLWGAVLSQKLESDILMMQPTKNWYRCDAAELLRPAKIRRVLFK